ncbi:uncharacterized protein LOC126326034 [Schistocerca gregaria]|uniref:uncharacterized protein LOC126326034 n=1 Tax=Schistocerca gregaria TaxID=7010 RepID=UPI00211E6136|nr:uncharacterized protein LOC126326034 [Schistocerca gregaria]
MTKSYPQRMDMIRLYYETAEKIQRFLPDQSADDGACKFNALCSVDRQEPALLRLVHAEKAGLFAVFGGQGPAWLDELTDLYYTYPFVRSFLHYADKQLNQLADGHPDFSVLFMPYGLHFLNWIHLNLQKSGRLAYQANAEADVSNASRQEVHFSADGQALSALSDGNDAAKNRSYRDQLPDSVFLRNAPVSYPLIFLTQMLNYWVTCRVWQKSPGEAAQLFRGATGHSQGLLGALVMSMATTEKQLLSMVLDGLKLMFYIGVRCQQASSSLTARTEIQQESQELGYSSDLTPMLSVLYLDRRRLQKHIDRVNSTLPTQPERHIELGLINSPQNYVVVGHPESLHQLVTVLNRVEMKVSKDERQDQSRVPYSKRKKAFTCRYLNVSVPFHWSQLSSVVPVLKKDAESLNLKYDVSDIRIPVYSTRIADGDESSRGQPSLSSAAHRSRSHEVQEKSCPFNLQDVDSDALLEHLFYLQCVCMVDWAQNLKHVSSRRHVTHIVDFGPGQGQGIGSLCARSLRGSGVHVIVGSGFESAFEPELKFAEWNQNWSWLDRTVLFDADAKSVKFNVDWSEEFGPKLVKWSSGLRSNAELSWVVDTKYTRFMGKPPVMVGGMTPTTKHPDLVSAILNAGFHGELAAGGLPTEQMLRLALDQLIHSIHWGHGVCINLLYLNPTLWSRQYPLILRLCREEGYPIDGITIAAGIPSLDKAIDIINEMREVGISYVAFKPSSVSSIYQALSIAQRVPDMTVLLQWTGGRGGGHHSFEDFHEAVLQTYSDIRQLPNVILIGGSGFGDAEHSWPYLTGEWSEEMGHVRMPFDAILIASRIMVAKEAHTVLPAKQLLVATSGVSREQDWEQSYEDVAGGVLTVSSELGEPIHKLATRGVLLWRQFDKEYFSLPPDKRAAKVEEKKSEIVQKINANFQKLYFGRKFNGQVCDLADMTYSEVAYRVVELSFIQRAPEGGEKPSAEGRWIHLDYMQLLIDFLVRVEERFALEERKHVFSASASGLAQEESESSHASDLDDDGAQSSSEDGAFASQLPDYSLLQFHPVQYLSFVFEQLYPRSSRQLLSNEDVDYFLQLCRKGGRKPVNFIPVIDKDLSYWFKKDSLWQSEDMDAIPGGDVQRVVILQGPVSVKYSTQVDQPVKEILNEIHNGWVAKLRATYAERGRQAEVRSNLSVWYSVGDGDKRASRVAADGARSARVPHQDALNGVVQAEIRIERARARESEQEAPSVLVLTLTLTSDPDRLPSAESWISWLSSHGSSTWWPSLMNAPFIAREHARDRNIFKSLLEPKCVQQLQMRFAVDVASRAEFASLVSAPECIPLHSTVEATRGLPLRSVRLVDQSVLPASLRSRYSCAKSSCSAQSRPFVAFEMQYEEEQAPGRLALTLYHWRVPTGSSSSHEQGVEPQVVPVQLLYNFYPEFGKACWSEVMECRNQRIKQFYASLWLDSEGDRLATSAATEPWDEKFCHSFTISRTHIEQFCHALNHPIQQRQQAGASRLVAPLDFSIVIAWKSLVRVLCLDLVDSDLLRLVHSSNRFQLLDTRTVVEESSEFPEKPGEAVKAIRKVRNEARCFVEEDRVDTEARLVELAETPSGQRVTVHATLSVRSGAAGGAPLVRIESQFLFRSHLSRSGTSFSRRSDEKLVRLDTVESLAILRGKPWMRWRHPFAAKDLKLRDQVVFQITTLEVVRSEPPEVRQGDWRGASGPASRVKTIRTTGFVIRQRPYYCLDVDGVLIAEIDMTLENQSPDRACVVQGYLSRFGRPLEPSKALERDGYVMAAPINQSVPLDSLPYALASGDLNPIHTNPYFATVAQLPGTIVHGMWTSAKALRALESVVNGQEQSPILSYQTEFLDMVMPGEVLSTSLRHVGMKMGKKLVEVRTEATRAETGERRLVLRGFSEVKAPKTAYVFTGQGSVEVNMGMDLYASSATAREIWDRADGYFLNQYGFSILNIVRNNPKQITVHFGGKLGEKIRSNYRCLVQETESCEGGEPSATRRPLFPGIKEDTKQYTFQHPDGLLFATQFSQPALVLTELAAFLNLRDRALVPSDCTFAGHSLGEYSALASIASILDVEPLVSVVFLRGVTMQTAVPRDECGRSSYAMVAVNPSRVHPFLFRQAQLDQVIGAIVAQRDELLQVVNYNIENYQYVVAGERGNLYVLGQVLNALHKQYNKYISDLEALVSGLVLQMSRLCGGKTSQIVLERGFATIPLPGIDVPFHSSFLKHGVPAFRNILQKRINPSQLNPDLLVGRYVPNVTAKPFSLEREYIEETNELIRSPVLDELLRDYERERSNLQAMAFKFLVELLAYQFTSPVQWIETQHYVFKVFNAERFIEIGPAPTLFTMAKRTLEIVQYSPLVRRQIMWLFKDWNEITYQFEDAAARDESESVEGGGEAAPVKPRAQSERAASASRREEVAESSRAGEPSPQGAPSALSPLTFIRALLSLRLKRRFEEIEPSKTIASFVGGKSSLQNELVGDLESEFGAKLPSAANELSIEALSSEIARGMPSGYRLGRVSSQLIQKLVGHKMPAGFAQSHMKRHLGQQFGLSDDLVQGALLYALTMEPPARLADEQAAREYLEQVFRRYAECHGVPVVAVAAASEGVAAVGAASAASAASAPASVPDPPLDTLFCLRVLLSLKLRQPLEKVAASSSISQLVGRKSALQNEILRDVQKEFESQSQDDSGDRVTEEALSEVASKYARSYRELGGYLQPAVAKLASSKLPGDFGLSKLKRVLEDRFGLGPNLQSMVLVYALTQEPAGRLASEGAVEEWLSRVVGEYAQKHCPALAVALARAQLEAYHEYFGHDLMAMERMSQLQAQLKAQLDEELAQWRYEHGDSEEYFEGIRPVFDTKKERRYNSTWNWNRQDCLQLYYDYACGRTTKWTVDIRERLYHIKNRAVPTVVDMVEHYSEKVVKDGHAEIQGFMRILADTLRRVMQEDAKYRELRPVTRPKVEIDQKGRIRYSEVEREGVCDMVQYVAEMERGPQQGVVCEAAKRLSRCESPLLVSETNGLRAMLSQSEDSAPSSEASRVRAGEQVDGTSELCGSLCGEKEGRGESQHALDCHCAGCLSLLPSCLPYLFIRTPHSYEPNRRVYSPAMTRAYYSVLRSMAGGGLSLANKVALVVGCGRGSIGMELVKALLRAGARVYATTSVFRVSSVSSYHSLYDQNGGKHSELVILPFNQASVRDIGALVSYLYDREKVDLDYVIPFAALSEAGRDIGSIDGKSELAHRIMMTNVLRLIGAIKDKKRQLSSFKSPAHVLLPLSPNHGEFGCDGLYAESKLGLEALLNKWHAEGWENYLSIVGAVIGWTRGTRLMSQNNIVSPSIESMGARTFTTREMCFNLMGLLHPDMVLLAQERPILADLNGCLHLVPNLNGVLKRNRKRLLERREIEKALPEGANARFARIRERLRGMLDLEQVVVVVGFGEIGPYGSARTRWEIEIANKFSLEGCLELAWMMGMIRYEPDPRSAGGAWVDAKTGERFHDYEVKARYESRILEHTGIRLIEPELFDHYDPQQKTFLHQVALSHQMAPIEVSREEAQAFKRKHGDAVDIYERKEDHVWFMQLRKGSTLYIPKSVQFDRFVAGQVPSTWDPVTLGVPHDLVQQVDRVTLYTLYAVVDAFLSAGITDPYELYHYVHVSQVGNSLGGGFGGMQSIRDTYRSRMLELPVQGDVLQETFINTVAAWINMLYLSSSGPVETPVGACATAVESLDIGYDMVRSGKARVFLVGGYDDFGEEGSYEFANMKATANSEAEVSMGRTPKEMSRPATSSRAGFVESHGAGVQLIMTASLAVEMGLPIYAIIEHVATATDKIGRSVPAPGQGILTTCRERSLGADLPVLDLGFRRRYLADELERIDGAEAPQEVAGAQLSGAARDWLRVERERRRRFAFECWSHRFYMGNPYIAPLRGALAVYGLTVDDIAVSSFHGTGTRGNDLNESEVLQKQLEHLGRAKGNVMLSIFQKYLTGHPKGAAAAWMLNGLIQSLLSGIVPGNRNADNIDPQFSKFDHIVYLNRSLHTYGYEAGLLKSFGFGQVGGEVLVVHPDYALSQLSDDELCAYSEKRLQRQDASYRHWQDSLTKKRSLIQLKENPPYIQENESKVYLDPLVRTEWDSKSKSWIYANERSSDAVQQKSADSADTCYTSSCVQPRPARSRSSFPACFRAEAQGARHARTASFGECPSSLAPLKSSPGMRHSYSDLHLNQIENSMHEMGEELRSSADRGIGVDAQLISEIEVCIENSDFVTRNFTPAEISYCRAAHDPSSAFAGRWAAKEAVIKAISSCDSENAGARNMWQGAGAPVRDIEIVPSGSGAPRVQLHGYAERVASALSITKIKVSISHSGEYAIAHATAR